MSAKTMLCAMVAGTALVMLVGARREPSASKASAPRRVEAQPWLSKEAAAQIVGADGRLGPLFAGVELGGPAPSIEVRERIEKFARSNHVDIQLEIVDAELASVRFAVSYAGCCGYEGADVLALRLRRPSTGGCCVCGPDTWINDWAFASDDGTYMRASVRVNRVEVRWERTLNLTGLLERANSLLGSDATRVRAVARERWETRHVPSRFYGEPDEAHAFVAMPYARRDYPADLPIDLRSNEDFGVQLGVQNGRIAEVSFAMRELGDQSDDAFKAATKALRSTWGRPLARSHDKWTWRTADRTITAELAAWPARVTIRAL
jgi:hypothetical protein